MKTSDEIKARYTSITRVADSRGRQIGICRLKVAQQARLMEFTESREPTLMAIMIAAASVREIDGLAISFPRTRAELDATLDVLDTEGLEVVAPAYIELVGSEDADPKP